MICDYCGYERGATVTAACPHCGAPASTSSSPEIETFMVFDPGSSGYRRKTARLRDSTFEGVAGVGVLPFPKAQSVH